MKKLSLILALVLVFTCGVLAACDDTAETSSEAATESSEAVVESSVAAESSEAEEESFEAEESSEAVSEEESKEPTVVEVGEVISTGKSYTTTAPNRGDSFDDDGKKLTNGTKGLEDAGTGESAGWNSLDKTVANVVEIVVDLGEATDSAAYRVYLAGGNWGIGVPNEFDAISIEIFAADSADGEFVSVASAPATDMVLVTGTGVTGDSWSTFTLTAGAAETVNAQFIKFVITAQPVGNGFIWMDEVEVFAPAA